MYAKSRSQNSRSTPSESLILTSNGEFQMPLASSCELKIFTAAVTPITPRTAPVVPRGQDCPRISLSRSQYHSENCSGYVVTDGDSSGLEETSPTYPRANNSNCSPSVLPCRTQSSSPLSGRSTPVNTPLYTVNASGSCCDHKRQFDSLQRKLTALAEKN